MATKTKSKRSFEQWKSEHRYLDVRPRIPYHHGFDDFVDGFAMNANSYDSTTDYLEYRKGYNHAKNEVAEGGEICERCGEAREIISLNLCENCLEARDRYEEDRMAEYMRGED